MPSRALLRLALLAILALLATPVVAAPVVAAPVVATPVVAARAVAPKPNRCLGEVWQGLWMTDWRLDVANDTIYNPEECGSGCLDNFRGRCGPITHWVCDRDAHSAHFQFASTRFCTAYDITQAVLACTQEKQNIGCMTTNIRHGGQGITDKKGKKGGKNGV